MWGGLAGRVSQAVKEKSGDFDLRSTIGRIGDVVAPTGSDNDDDDEYTDDDDDDDDDDDSQEAEYEETYYEEPLGEPYEANDQQQQQQQQEKTFGGFVSLLGRAMDMDSEQHQHDEGTEGEILQQQLEEEQAEEGSWDNDTQTSAIAVVASTSTASTSAASTTNSYKASDNGGGSTPLSSMTTRKQSMTENQPPSLRMPTTTTTQPTTGLSVPPPPPPDQADAIARSKKEELFHVQQQQEQQQEKARIAAQVEASRVQIEVDTRLANIARRKEEARLLEEGRSAAAAAAAKEARLAEEARVVEEERLATLARAEAQMVQAGRMKAQAIALEKTKVAEAARLAEVVRWKAEEKARAEEEARLQFQLQDEARAAREAQEQYEAEARAEEEQAKLAEQAQFEAEARAAKEARITEQARLEREARETEEARIAKEARAHEEGKARSKEKEEARLKEEEQARIVANEKRLEVDKREKADAQIKAQLEADANARLKEEANVVRKEGKKQSTPLPPPLSVASPILPIRQSVSIYRNQHDGDDDDSHARIQQLMQDLQDADKTSRQLEQRLEQKMKDQESASVERIQQLQQLSESEQEEAQRCIQRVQRESQDQNSASERRVEQLEQETKLLSQQLNHAESHVVELQQEAIERLESEEGWQSSVVEQQKEHHGLMEQATTSAEEAELLRKQTEDRYLLLEQEFERERNGALQQAEQLRILVQQAEARAESAEADKNIFIRQQENITSQSQQRQDRAVQMAEEKMSHSMAVLDEREDEIENLKTVTADLRATLAKNQLGVEEVEDEADELHTENEQLHQRLQAMESERRDMTKKLQDTQADHERIGGLQIELNMLQEERDRVRAQKKSVTESAQTNTAKIASDRDSALAECRDLQQQLTATLADLNVAQADTARGVTASGNLQYALEAFQAEREAELGILDEQKRGAEEVTSAAYAAAIHAINETNIGEMKQVQMASDAAIHNVMGEVKSLETNVEAHRKENVQLRRSLDEAINRLSVNQEDVVDRTLMKNILLDWFSKNGKGKKEVLQVMASLLHFSDEEKGNIHIGEGHGVTLEKVKNAVVVPLPPSRADVDQLEGDNVREKWINFLLAETDGDN